MSYKVLFLEYAEHDLRNIHAYVEQQFSLPLANQVYTGIKNATLLLENKPDLGRKLPQLTHLGITDFRQLVVARKNKVVYQIDEDQQHIYIHLICNERQDFDAVLTQRLLDT